MRGSWRAVVLLSCLAGCAAIPSSSAPGEGSRVATVDARWCIGGESLVVEDWEVPYGAERIGPARRTRFEGARVVDATHRHIAEGRLLAARIRLQGLPKEHRHAAAFGYAALGDAQFGDAATREQACLDYGWAMAQVYSLGNAPLDTGLASYLGFMLAWCDVTLPPPKARAHILIFAARLREAARKMAYSELHTGLVAMFETSLEQVVAQIPEPQARRCVGEHPRRARDPGCAALYPATHGASVMCGD